MSEANMSGSCDEVLEELHRYLDGELPQSRLEQIRAHLARCYPCTDRVNFEDQLKAIVRDNCTDRAPAGLVKRIRERLDQTQLAAE